MGIKTWLPLVICSLVFVGCAQETDMKTDSSASLYEQMDTNEDGVVSQSEYDAQQKQRMERYDRDDNGQVSKAEFHDGMMWEFDQVDADDDDTITLEEMNNAFLDNGVRYNQAEEGVEVQKVKFDKDGKMTEAEYARVIFMWHANADANNDGEVTREEFEQHAETLYAQADQNKDGHLTPQEMKFSGRLLRIF